MTIEGVGEVPGYGTLVEFDPPNKLVYETTLPTDPNVRMRVSVEFTEVEQGTKVVLVRSGIPDERVDGEYKLRAIIQTGWMASLEKLEALFDSAHTNQLN